jgi:hypothetical protein
VQDGTSGLVEKVWMKLRKLFFSGNLAKKNIRFYSSLNYLTQAKILQICVVSCKTNMTNFFILYSEMWDFFKWISVFYKNIINLSYPQVDIDDLVLKLIQFQWASLRNYRFLCYVVICISKKLIFVRSFVSLTL